MMLAQSNPVPFVNQPLVPSAIAPAGPSFTLTVNGTGFVSGSVVNWNGTPLSTTFVSDSQLTATVPASNIATPSSASITVSSPSPGGGTSNVLFLAVAAPETSVQFLTVSSTTTPPGVVPNTQAPVVGDFTGNGKLDLVVGVNAGGADSYTLWTFLSNNNGTFQLLLSNDPPDGLTYFASGDFNRDGILDLVGVFNDTGVSSSLDFMMGIGNGTFSQSSGVYGIPPPMTASFDSSVVTGDFNADGNLDVALVVGGPPATSDGVYVFLGNGDGTFQSPVISNTGSFLQNLQFVGGVGDFNRDGKLDLIGISPTQLAFLQGNGDGTFQAPSTFYPVNGSVNAADLNGDDKLDLITVQYPPTNTVTVLLGNGDGTFTPQPAYPVSISMNSPAAVIGIGDFYANGKLDLVVPSVLLPGNGDGTFQSPIALPVSALLGAAGDFNNDGRLDLVVNSPSDTEGPVYLFNDAPVASLNPSTSLSFGPQVRGATSAAKAVVLSNVGTGPLKVTSISITGAQAGEFSFDSLCGSTPTLAVNASCQINVTFTPSASDLGPDAALTISSNAIGSPSSVSLTGTTEDFSLTPTTNPTVSVSPSETAVYQLNIVPEGGFNHPVTLTCSGAPAQSTCSVSPNSITLNGSSASTATVRVTTAVSGVGMTQPFSGPRGGSIIGSWAASWGTLALVMMMASLVGLGVDVRRRLAPYGLALLLLFSIGVTMSACSGNSGGGGTPAGSYTLTVTGTFTGSSATLSHATKLTLIVK